MSSFDPAALRGLRPTQGMTLDTLGARAGVARPNLIAYELGGHPSVEILVALARALRVDPWELTTVDPAAPTLADLRLHAGITKTELASRLGIPRTTWHLVETGKRRLRPPVATAVAKALGVSARRVREAWQRGVDAEPPETSS
ncbi:MAG: helix-turn-helix domain-containing protein [Acidimicrobiales bacterium]